MCAVRLPHNADAHVSRWPNGSEKLPATDQHVARMSAAKSGMFRVEAPDVASLIRATRYAPDDIERVGLWAAPFV
jgi:hypothetical protein